MLGPIVATGVGALAFKLGMEAQQMSSEGKSAIEIATRLPERAFWVTKGAIESCYNYVAGLFKEKPKQEKQEGVTENVKEERPE